MGRQILFRMVVPHYGEQGNRFRSSLAPVFLRRGSLPFHSRVLLEDWKHNLPKTSGSLVDLAEVLVFKYFAVLLIIFGSYICILNVFALIKRRSSVPFLGGLCLFFGLYGFEPTRHFAFLGFLVDWGTVLLVWAIPNLLYEWWETSRRNLECHFTANVGGRNIEIMLFKSGKFTMDLHFDPPIAGENGAFLASRSKPGKWDEENGTYYLRDNERVLKIIKDGTVHRTLEEQVTPDQPKAFQLDNLILHKKS